MLRNCVAAVAVTLLISASGARAQTDSTATPPATMPPAAEATPEFSIPDKPPAELAKLKLFEGSWTAKTHIYASPLGPESEGTSKATYKWAFGGMHLEGTHELTRGGKPMTGRSIWGWDSDRKQYQMVWVDALTPITFLYYGTFPQENSLVVFATSQLQGKTFTEKMTVTFPDPNKYNMVIESDLSGTMQKVREETGTRVKAGAKKKTTAKSSASSTAKKKAG